jgi:hypothetical protein
LASLISRLGVGDGLRDATASFGLRKQAALFIAHTIQCPARRTVHRPN